MFCDINFMYGLYHDCARTLKRSFAGKLAIVQLSSGFSFARNSSRAPCALASFSRARIPRSACTRDVTCELYCTKDQHGIRYKDLAHKDKQNFEAVSRITASCVLDLLEQVPDAKGTMHYLKCMQYCVDAYLNKNLTPLERIH